ncbi:unnamed protein product [Clavelina lepadiformis]|uniref:Transmembrane 6 superfamily member 1/2 transmembrane domain-containing protein n=1 Tax=Clavelina lepadiformis TaxID=159417 RepID=A0ABP0GV88_CLALP
MANFTGVAVSILISLTAFPLVELVTTDSSLSAPLPLMLIGFGLLLLIALTLKFVLPQKCVEEQGKDAVEQRGFVYYTCCLFMWACTSDLCLQIRNHELFGFRKNTKYFEHGEAYLVTPLGIFAQFWNGIINYILYVIIIYQIDNKKDSRYSCLYWSGGILTSQFVVLVGAFTGSYSNKLEYSVWLNAVFVFLPLWILQHCWVKPRPVAKNFTRENSSFPVLDLFLCTGLVLASVFGLIRGLGALGSQTPLIKYYVEAYEPYMLESSKYGAVWPMYVAIYGIPFQLCAIYGLLHPGCQWMLNCSVVYAAGMLQVNVWFLITKLAC